jgi:hypothetical protein
MACQATGDLGAEESFSAARLLCHDWEVLARKAPVLVFGTLKANGLALAHAFG